MATKKKTQTLPTRKSALQQILFSLLIAFIVAGSIYVLSSIAAKLFYEMPRTARVHEIIASLDLPPEFIEKGNSIVGEKRTYREDGTRSWSSYQQYVRGASVDTAVNELDKYIKAAGFTPLKETEPATMIATRSYRNDKGEYIVMTAESKPRMEYYQNALIMNTDPALTAANAIDPNTGPVKITLKINLDNNRQ